MGAKRRRRWECDIYLYLRRCNWLNINCRVIHRPLFKSVIIIIFFSALIFTVFRRIKNIVLWRFFFFLLLFFSLLAL